MKILFIGDIHGRVLHTLALSAKLHQRENFDMIIQVGDLGAYPTPSKELLNNKFYQWDSSQLDFSRFLNAKGTFAENIRFIRNQISQPIYFIRGNHEDFDWLDELSLSGKHDFIDVDSFGAFRYVSDGIIMNLQKLKICFMGGIETEVEEQRSINEKVYQQLLELEPGYIDILVTHDAPYGIGMNYYGETQGSKKISYLIDNLKPKYLVAGHYHHMNGPRNYGNTTYLGLNVLVDLRKDKELKRVQSGSLAILNTDLNDLDFVTDEWLSTMDKDFDFNDFVEKIKGSL